MTQKIEKALSPAANDEVNNPQIQRQTPSSGENGALNATFRLRPWRTGPAFLLLLVPALLQLYLVYRYGVDLPYNDQWEAVGALFGKMDAGTLGIGDFFAQHNEHRILFPMLIFYSLGKLTHWNVRAELFAIWILYILLVWNLWRLMIETGFGITRRSYWLLLAVCVLFFSPLQWQNQLWGFQIGFVLPLLFVVASLRVALSARHPWNYLGTMLLGLACTFSIASGFMCWILTLPVLLMRGRRSAPRNRKMWLPVWCGVFAAGMALYLHGYVKPPYPMSLQEELMHPIQALRYWLTYLGLPFAFGTVWAPSVVSQAAGALLALSLCAAAGYLWRWRRDFIFIGRTLPWMMFSFVTIISATLTTVGRMGFGIKQALASRYVTFAIPLPVGLAMLTALILDHRHQRDPSPEAPGAAGTVRTGIISLSLTLALLHVLGSLKVLYVWPRTQHAMLTAKALIETINLVDEPELIEKYVEMQPVLPLLRRRVNTLDKIGYLRPGVIKADAPMSAICNAGDPGDARYGELQQTGNLPDQQIALKGWAILPDKRRTADAVLLTYDDAKGKPVVFAVADVDRPRDDSPGGAEPDDYSSPGWIKLFSRGKLPAGWVTIKVWAFDSEKCLAYQLKGSVNVQR